MKLVLKSIQINTKNVIKSNVPYMRVFPSLHVQRSFTFIRSDIFNSIRYSFSKSKETQNNERQQAESKNFKLQQLKQLFETKMNKYNLKGLLKMYQILRHNNVHLSEVSLKQFDYRLSQQLNSIDHQSTNSILEMMYRNGQQYQVKGKNKLLRGINMKLQKNKLNIEPQQVYKTIKLLIEMNFPKSTLNKVLFKLVIENQPQKRIIYQIDNLNALKICFIAIKNVELDLQLKKRMLKNLLLIKPKGVVELVYFYSVLKIVVHKLDQTVSFEAQKRTVYDLAFNPYSFSQVNEEPVQVNQQQNTDKKTQNDKKQFDEQNGRQQKPKVNQTILKNLLIQKEKILQQIFQKFNIEKVSQQIFNQLNEILSDKKNDEFKFKDKKQVAMLLLANKFKNDSNKNKKLMIDILQSILNESLGDSIKTTNDIDNQRILRVNEFVTFMQELVQNSDAGTIRVWIDKYKLIYYNLMSLEEKLMFLYFRARVMNEKVRIAEIKQEIKQINYGLNAEEFVWLHRVLTIGQEKYSNEEKQIVKSIWRLVEENLDNEIGSLKRNKDEQEKQKQQQQQNEQPNEATPNKNKN